MICHEERLCGLCGEPCKGYAWIGETPYHHGDGFDDMSTVDLMAAWGSDEVPPATCHERQSLGLTEEGLAGARASFTVDAPGALDRFIQSLDEGSES